ncbi:hypothetical protein B0H13DRAFT_1904411 [Mycena leptocephala]|nr:hypothetical protein B0H13DRAFT_1904411 [Mycena leptocephala]
MSNSAYAEFVEPLAAIAKLLELRQTLWNANFEYKTIPLAPLVVIGMPDFPSHPRQEIGPRHAASAIQRDIGVVDARNVVARPRALIRVRVRAAEGEELGPGGVVAENPRSESSERCGSQSGMGKAQRALQEVVGGPGREGGSREVVEDEWKDKGQIDKCERNPGQENQGGGWKKRDGGVANAYRVLGKSPAADFLAGTRFVHRGSTDVRGGGRRVCEYWGSLPASGRAPAAAKKKPPKMFACSGNRPPDVREGGPGGRAGFSDQSSERKK